MRSPTHGRGLRPLRSVRVRATRPPMPPQPELLDLWRLSRGGRGGSWEADLVRLRIDPSDPPTARAEALPGVRSGPGDAERGLAGAVAIRVHAQCPEARRRL